MKVTSTDVVRALLDLSRNLPAPMEFLRGVRDELTRKITTEEQTVHAVIVTPTGDAGGLKDTVLKLLSQKFPGRPVDLQEQADSTLIGGAVVRFGDEQVDMSVRTALQQAADQFASSARAS